MSITATKLLELRASYPNQFDKFENRGQKYGLLDLAITNANSPQGITGGDIQAKAKASWGRTFKIPAMTPISSANGGGLTCAFGNTNPISEYVALTFATISNGFKLFPSEYFENELTYEQVKAQQYSNTIRSIAKAVDTLVDVTLTSNIAAAAEYNNPYAGTKYPFVGNVLQVTQAQIPNFFGDMVAINASDDLEDQMFDVVGSTNLSPKIRQIFAQGMANSTNTQYQFQTGDWDFRYSNRVLVTPVTSESSFFVLPKGAVSLLSRNNPLNVKGRTTGDGMVYSTLFEPNLGMTMDTLYQDKCFDAAAQTGNPDNTASVEEGYQYSINIALLTPFSSFGGATPSSVPSVIRKADFLLV